MSEQNPNIDTLWRTYEIINDWIKFSDTKAAAILAMNGVIIGVVLTAILTNLSDAQDYLKDHTCLRWLLILGIILEAASIICCFFCLKPTLRNKNPSSLIYFGDIYWGYKTSSEYMEAVKEQFTHDEKTVSHIADQIWINSKIAWKKYVAVGLALVFLTLTICIGIVGLFILL